MTALYIILAVVAVIMLLLLIPADCILEFSYNNKENNGSVIIKYAFLKFKIFPNDKVEEEVENEEETTDKEEKQEKSDILGIITLIKEVYKQLKKDILNLLDYIICHAIKIKELNVSSKFGMGNPMYTGIATGAVNAGGSPRDRRACEASAQHRLGHGAIERHLYVRSDVAASRAERRLRVGVVRWMLGLGAGLYS